MKTFQQFCDDACQLNEFINFGKTAKVVGAVVGGAAIKSAAKNPIVDKAVNIGTSAIGMGRFGPAAVGATIGSEILAPAAIKLAQQRRAAADRRLNQLVPSGKPENAVSGKPAQIVPLRK
jgi:hypothetical protein